MFVVQDGLEGSRVSNPKNCWWWYALAGLAMVVAAFGRDVRAGDVPPHPGAVAHVVVESGRLSVDVHDAGLAEVLQAVGRHAGVKVVVRGNLDTRVTQSFTHLPLDQGIQRLARGHSVVLIYRPSSQIVDNGVLIEAWVIVSSGEVAVGSRQTVQAESSASSAPRYEPRPELMRALKDWEPEVRLQAIQEVVSDQGVYAIQVLSGVVTEDPSPHVRRAAVRLLGSMNTDEARQALGVAMGDGDPRVREAATRASARWWDHTP
jgi:HEAT repeats